MSVSVTVPSDTKSPCKDDAMHKPLKYWCFDESWCAELPAIADASAPMSGTTVREAGAAVGRTNPRR
jgi:hypothetical protein